MGGKKDQIKGRIKEAAGGITNNERLKREGKLDQVVGEVKETAEKVVETLTRQHTSQPGRLSRQGKGNGVRTAPPATLILWPCLCDLQETLTRRRLGAGANLRPTRSLPAPEPREIDTSATGSADMLSEEGNITLFK